LAVMSSVILYDNQGDDIIDQAIAIGKSADEAKSILFNSIIAKGLSLLLLIALFCIGNVVSKRLVLKSRVRYLPILFILYALLYGGVCALTHKFLNPFFEFSLLNSSPINFQMLKTIPPLVFYSTIGLATLFSSSTLALLAVKKTETKKTFIYSFGSQFWTVNYFFNFILIAFIYYISGLAFPILSLGAIVIIINLLIFALMSTFIGCFALSSILEDGKFIFNNLAERLSRGIISSFGVFSFPLVLLIIAFGLDSSFLTTLEQIPIMLFRLIIFTAISGSIAAIIWKFNIAGVKNELTIASTSSELTFLKSQINPHFLFNSLNTVYALALNEESPKTAHAVQQLSEMMRFMLHENTAEKIELRKEVEYLENFIELQKLRLDQNQNIQLDIEIDDACEGEIAPMLLIPFVENAFKHGISLKEPSWIKIRLSCADKKVHLNVNNSVHKRLEDPEMGKSGIGQENVRKRLAILYPEKHLFQLYEAEDNYGANIKIDLS
jgi:sensor histidine kinase YesM